MWVDSTVFVKSRDSKMSVFLKKISLFWCTALANPCKVFYFPQSVHFLARL